MLKIKTFLFFLVFFPNVLHGYVCKTPFEKYESSWVVKLFKQIKMKQSMDFDHWKIKVPIFFVFYSKDDEIALNQNIENWASKHILFANNVFKSSNAPIQVFYDGSMIVRNTSFYREQAYKTHPSVMRQRYNNKDVKTFLFVTVSKTFCDSDGCRLGYAYLPNLFEENLPTNNYIWLSRSAPLSTLTHEIGHSFNLLHTFHQQKEKPCSADKDDQVHDTAMELKSFSSCENTKCSGLSRNVCDTNTNCMFLEKLNVCGVDSCPGDAGPDPCRNIMSYHKNVDEFSPGQIERMRLNFVYRIETYSIWNNLAKDIQKKNNNNDLTLFWFIASLCVLIFFIGGVILCFCTSKGKKNSTCEQNYHVK